MSSYSFNWDRGKYTIITSTTNDYSVSSFDITIVCHNNMQINSYSLKNIVSNYWTYNSDTQQNERTPFNVYLVNYNTNLKELPVSYEPITFDTNIIAKPGDTYTFTIRSENTRYFYFAIDAVYNCSQIAGSSGIHTITLASCPDFDFFYTILDDPYLIDSTKEINEGYPYFNDYGYYSDYSSSEWLIDSTKEINEGYPYFYKFPSAVFYSDYVVGSDLYKVVAVFLCKKKS